MGLPIALRDEHHAPVSRSLGSRVGQGFPFRSAATFSSSKDSLCFGSGFWFLEVAPEPRWAGPAGRLGGAAAVSHRARKTPLGSQADCRALFS
jgi:hypothetical protein